MIDMALRRPGWSLLLIRSSGGALARKSFGNSSTCRTPVIQGKHHTEIPRYMNGMDVGLMNYVTQDTWMPFLNRMF